MYDALEVSQYIIDYCREKKYYMSNLKLQKVLYYVQIISQSRLQQKMQQINPLTFTKNTPPLKAGCFLNLFDMVKQHR